MVSYTQGARWGADRLLQDGFMERPERIVLIYSMGRRCLSAGIRWPGGAVGAGDPLRRFTVIHRIRYTYLETERRKLQPTR